MSKAAGTLALNVTESGPVTGIWFASNRRPCWFTIGGTFARVFWYSPDGARHPTNAIHLYPNQSVAQVNSIVARYNQQCAGYTLFVELVNRAKAAGPCPMQ